MKGVAIQYIIAVILGVVVIGLIGFWLFKSIGTFGGQTTLQSCKEREVRLCTQWAAKGFGIPTSGTLPEDINNFNKDCNVLLGHSLSDTECKKVLGLS